MTGHQHDNHPLLHHTWDALAVLLVFVAVICAMFLDVEYGQLTAVSRLALGGLIVAAVGVVVAKRLIERRR